MRSLLFFGFAFSCGAFAWCSSELPPFESGPYPVGMTSFEVSDAYKNLPVEQIHDFLGGGWRAGSPRYVADILKSDKAVKRAEMAAPDNPLLYGRLAGESIPIAYYVAYPTTDDNDREDYAFPYSRTDDATFSRMQRGGEAPIFPEGDSKFPLVLISHGHSAHAIWEISRAKSLASNGYIAVAIFHGDNRIPGGQSAIQQRFFRPLAVKATIDDLLSGEFAQRIDQKRIGITGTSFGGMTALASLGGRLDDNPASTSDLRIVAGVGMLSFVGNTYGGARFFCFGQDNRGLERVSAPFLAVYGTADTIAPPSYILPALEMTKGSVYAVAMQGSTHQPGAEVYRESRNWELLFFDAHLKGDAKALAQLKEARAFAGGADDRQQFDKQRIVER